MKFVNSEEFYNKNCNKITKLLIEWSRNTYTNRQAAELAGYNEENWHRIGPGAHITHIEYLASDYNRYQQNFDQICSHLNQDNTIKYPIIETKQDLLDFYAKEVEQDGSKTLIDSVLWFIACWTASSFVELGTKHLANILLDGVGPINEDSIEKFLEENSGWGYVLYSPSSEEENQKQIYKQNLKLILIIFEYVGDKRAREVAEEIEELEEEE